MWRQFMGDGPRTTRMLSTRSQPDGSFAIKNAPPGKYIVRVTAEGHTSVSTDPFTLAEDQSGFEIALGFRLSSTQTRRKRTNT